MQANPFDALSWRHQESSAEEEEEERGMKRMVEKATTAQQAAHQLSQDSWRNKKNAENGSSLKKEKK